MELPFNEGGVSVTRNALSVAGQVLALRDIADLRVVTVKRNRAVPVVLGLIGIAGAIASAVYGSAAGLVCGAMLVVVGILSWYTQDVTHRLVVVSGGEPREVLSSLDRAFAGRVETALRNAMESRNAAAAPGGERAQP
ncbi:hypothetical protein CY652_00365 [Burkholderia sp. WAC0059]|uniref:DUF6232 family protein n=1 Tax=Burkholderia sp. WAC0059 TaxID=2066022 RepID=UPI000C7F0221|nr:DUF6232 family protein [Burkholderia sp. WAC0059]PLZ04174.1 hypothetical protein CY652_00365 [Burkholderia sp. WAC0059]